MNGYELSRNWFDWCFENPEKIKPNHTALYFFAVEHCNRLGWKKKYGMPTTMAMEAIGIKSYNTYINTLNDLVEWGFIEMIQRSKNQYSANIVALSNFDKALDKALDEALIKHASKQSESTRQSTCSIDKQLNKEQLTSEELLRPSDFDQFWKAYGKQQGRFPCEQLWRKLEQKDIDAVLEHVPKFVKASGEYLINPEKYLKDRRWLDEELPDHNKEPKVERYKPNLI